jgi:hypothetical protein
MSEEDLAEQDPINESSSNTNGSNSSSSGGGGGGGSGGGGEIGSSNNSLANTNGMDCIIDSFKGALCIKEPSSSSSNSRRTTQITRSQSDSNQERPRWALFSANSPLKNARNLNSGNNNSGGGSGNSGSASASSLTALTSANDDEADRAAFFHERRLAAVFI